VCNHLLFGVCVKLSKVEQVSAKESVTFSGRRSKDLPIGKATLNWKVWRSSGAW
jgi:hypothetical protein